MKKKTAIIVGIIMLVSSLFINLIVSGHSEETDLTFNNIEALAEKEFPDTNPKPQCVESGYICFGSDKNGSLGRHPGLVKNDKE